MSHSDDARAPDLVPDWVKDAVFYQIFPDRFCRSRQSRSESRIRFQAWGAQPDLIHFQGGDLRGIIEKLDYLQELGITALYLNPIFASAANHRYHTFDYFTVDPLLGGNEAFRALLDAVHDRGMRLILDGVFNHVSRGFWAFHHVLETQYASPYVEWFHTYGFPLQPYTTDEAGACNYEAWWGLPALPKLNTHNPEVQAYLWKVAQYWIEFGIDGWRLDVPEEISHPDFWPTFREVVKGAKPDAYLVGEIWGQGQGWLDGDRFDGITNYAFGRHALGFFARQTLVSAPLSIAGHEIRSLAAEDFAREVEHMVRMHAWDAVQCNLNYLDSHDTPRLMHLVRGDTSAVRLMQGFQMTMPGAPTVYYGTEIGLAGGDDPDCRRAFPWQAPETWEHGLRAHCQWLIQMRGQYRALRTGRYVCLHAQGDIFAFKRFLNQELIYVVFNAGASPVTAELMDEHRTRNFFVLRDAATGETVRSLKGRTEAIRIPGRSMRILVRDND